ncbi:MAG: zf-HC2 domain-containing protein [Elusimicrobiaceae bacterium]
METLDHSEKVLLYHYGELPEPERAAFERHLADCPDCRATLGVLRGVHMVLADAAAPSALVEGLKGRFGTKWYQALFHRHVLRLAAAGACVSAAFIVMTSVNLSNRADFTERTIVSGAKFDVKVSTSAGKETPAEKKPAALSYQKDDIDALMDEISAISSSMESL